MDHVTTAESALNQLIEAANAASDVFSQVVSAELVVSNDEHEDVQRMIESLNALDAAIRLAETTLNHAHGSSVDLWPVVT